MPTAIQKELEKLLADQERMPMRTILKKLRPVCRKTGASIPARASLYHFMASAPTPEYRPSILPRGVQNALYNLDPAVPVPGRQLAFYCFNYGDLEALLVRNRGTRRANGLFRKGTRCLAPAGAYLL